MPSLVNKIGSYDFITLRGEPTAIAEQVELIQRPGVDGVAIRKFGKRGRRYNLLSTVDAASVLNARFVFESYTNLIGADPVPLIWRDLDSSPETVAVLEVTQQRIIETPTIVGGLQYTSGAILLARWQLIGIPEEETPPTP